VFQITRRCPSKNDTELAKIFLEGKTVSEAMEIICKQRSVNYMSRKAFSEAFNVMQELKDFDREPNWTEVRVISNKYNMSYDRVQLLATAMLHADWKPSKMTRRIIENLRTQEIQNGIT
jgi:hypothetical protein